MCKRSENRIDSIIEKKLFTLVAVLFVIADVQTAEAPFFYSWPEFSKKCLHIRDIIQKFSNEVNSFRENFRISTEFLVLYRLSVNACYDTSNIFQIIASISNVRVNNESSI